MQVYEHSAVSCRYGHYTDAGRSVGNRKGSSIRAALASLGSNCCSRWAGVPSHVSSLHSQQAVHNDVTYIVYSGLRSIMMPQSTEASGKRPHFCSNLSLRDEHRTRSVCSMADGECPARHGYSVSRSAAQGTGTHAKGSRSELGQAVCRQAVCRQADHLKKTFDVSSFS